jgi:hypothetical protein
VIHRTFRIGKNLNGESGRGGKTSLTIMGKAIHQAVFF